MGISMSRKDEGCPEIVGFQGGFDNLNVGELHLSLAWQSQ